MTKYRVQVDDKTYSVEIEALSNMKEEVKTSEDISFSAFVSEYEHCVNANIYLSHFPAK